MSAHAPTIFTNIDMHALQVSRVFKDYFRVQYPALFKTYFELRKKLKNFPDAQPCVTCGKVGTTKCSVCNKVQCVACYQHRPSKLLQCNFSSHCNLCEPTTSSMCKNYESRIWNCAWHQPRPCCNSFCSECKTDTCDFKQCLHCYINYRGCCVSGKCRVCFENICKWCAQYCGTCPVCEDILIKTHIEECFICTSYICKGCTNKIETRILCSKCTRAISKKVTRRNKKQSAEILKRKCQRQYSMFSLTAPKNSRCSHSTNGFRIKCQFKSYISL